MDGGGIYGYMTALMLERLCAQDPDFLSPTSKPVDLFAGTSAGALNALLLARQPNPRDYVVSGKLKAFWHQSGLFSNIANPVDAFWSLFGITAWLGTQDFKDVLQQEFLDLKLSDLAHHAMVTMWDWNGAGANPSWRPIVFSDRIVSQQNRTLVDVAYGAAAPAPLRAVFGGLGDGGFFAPNPSMYAYAFSTHEGNKNFLDNENFAQFQGVTGNNIAILSVGTATGSPSYFLKNFNFGIWPFSLVPTNPMQSNWYPPGIQLALDAPTESETLLSEEILGDFYHRLDPPVLNPPWAPPVLVGTSLARYEWWRQYLILLQDTAINSSQAVTAITGAVNFLNSIYWTG